MRAGHRRALPLEKDPFEGNMIGLFLGKTREDIEEKRGETRIVCVHLETSGLLTDYSLIALRLSNLTSAM